MRCDKGSVEAKMRRQFRTRGGGRANSGRADSVAEAAQEQRPEGVGEDLQDAGCDTALPKRVKRGDV